MADDSVDQRQADLIRQAVDEAFRAFERAYPAKAQPIITLSERDIRKIVREEAGDVAAKALEPVIERIRGFVESDEIDIRIVTAVESGFKSIGLLIDKDHLEETGSRVRGILEWQKVIDQAWRTLRSAAVLAILYALMTMIGVHLPSSFLGGH